jgi:formate hydrogenlyase subunit 6/NADH:ubiquinone oxidoreductase subunit I
MLVEGTKILGKKTIYNLEELAPSGSRVRNLYPDLIKCQGCNTCVMSCPQDLDVMGYISNALRGEIAEVAYRSFDCAMCSLCADRCPAGLAPYNIALLCRRLYGRYLVPRSRHLASRVTEIKEGRFDAELLELKKMEKSKLHRRYNERDVEP